MAWSEVTRLKYRCDGLRYASDLTDAEWSVIDLSTAIASRPSVPKLRTVVRALVAALGLVAV